MSCEKQIDTRVESTNKLIDIHENVNTVISIITNSNMVTKLVMHIQNEEILVIYMIFYKFRHT